ncbi:MAG: DUF1592 domain-containing protein [Verrucomicrobiota bacterium]
MHPFLPKIWTWLASMSAAALALAPAETTAAQDDAFPLDEHGHLNWSDFRVLMAENCFDCHGGFLKEGGVDLFAMREESSIVENPELWESVSKALRIHYMPPADHRNFPTHRREAMVRTVDAELLAAAEQEQADHASLRRLNRNEFANTLRDLLLVDYAVEDELPPDDSGYGFDNNADVLPVSPLLLEKYLNVAADVGERAVPLPIEPRQVDVYGIEMAGYNGTNRNNAYVVYSDEQRSSARYAFKHVGQGDYEARIFLAGQQAGDEPCRARVVINGKSMGDFVVEAEDIEDPLVATVRFTVRNDRPAYFRIDLLNDYYNKDAPEGEPNDRNLIVGGMEIEGPFQTEENLYTPFLKRHFGQIPNEAPEDVLRDGIWRFASRAYRRPAAAEEISSLWAVYTEENKRTNNPRRALRAVVDSALSSPNFIFRWEPKHSRDEFALASWLSYFIWGSMPDDQLFDLAKDGNLRANLESEIKRMLSDPRAKALTNHFAAQWLQFRDLDQSHPDRKKYPQFSYGLRHSMKQETQRFFEDLIKKDRSIMRVLDADYTFANKQLAEFYGLSEAPEKGFQKVSLEGTHRRGVWSQGSVLIVTSHVDRSSPVLRGKYILENLIGMEPPPPPANIPSLSTAAEQPTPKDFRDSLAIHRDNPDCASCHKILDPLGLVLESYDGIGAWRSSDDHRTREVLFDGTEIELPSQLAEYLVNERQDEFLETFAEKLAIYASGRGLDWRDQPAINQIVTDTEENDFRFSAIMTAVIEQFGPGMEPPPAR